MIDYQRVVQLQKVLGLNNNDFLTMLGVQKSCLAQWSKGVPIHPTARKKIYCILATMKNKESRSKLLILIESGKSGREIIYKKVNIKVAEKIPMSQLTTRPFNYKLLDIFMTEKKRIELVKKKKIQKLSTPITFDPEKFFNMYDPISLGGLDEGFDSFH